MKKMLLISTFISLMVLNGCSAGQKETKQVEKVAEVKKVEVVQVDKKQIAKKAIREIKKGAFDQAKLYLEQGADVNVEARGETMLSVSMVSGNLEIIKLVLEKNPNLDFEDEKGNTYLMMAKNAEIAKILIEAGADVDKPNSKGKKMILDVVKSDNSDVLKVLVDGGANLEIKNVRGNTPLLMAVMENKIENTKILIEAGAKLDIKNTSGDTALMKAVNKDIMILLVEAGAKLDIKNDAGLNVGEETMMLAIFKGYTDVVEAMINKGMAVDFTDSYGDTPLALAQSRGHQDIIDLINVK